MKGNLQRPHGQCVGKIVLNLKYVGSNMFKYKLQIKLLVLNLLE